MRKSCRLFVLGTIGIVLSSFATGQTPGNPAAYGEPTGQSSPVLFGSSASIDASVFYNYYININQQKDICQIINGILLSQFGVTYPSGGTVIDARGITISPAPLPCTINPFNGITASSPVPTTILLPGARITISTPWILPSYTRIIGEGPAATQLEVSSSTFPAGPMIEMGSTTVAQNPIPQIVGPVKPSAVSPGSGAFTLTVYGANFVAGAIVNWNGQPRSTTFVSAHELQAQILSTDVATNTAGLISVTNPAPGGGSSSSSWAQVEVHAPISAISLKPRVSYNFGLYFLLPADFDHDGTLDLLAMYGNDIVFYSGGGNGSFQFKSIAGRYYNGNLGAFGDFNNDGNLDFAFSQTLPTNSSVFAAVMLGDGTGKFKFGSGLTTKSDPTASVGMIEVGDFNGDGILDLVVTDFQGFSLYLGKGDGTFRHVSDIPDSTYGSQWIAVGDFNGDGKLDVIVSVMPDIGSYTYFFAGNGDGTFQSEQTVLSSTSLFADGWQTSDLNGDGKLDLAFSTLSQIGIMLGNGDGTFQAPIYVDAGSTNAQFRYAIGDVNSDGKPDLVVSQYYDFNHPTLAIYLGNGDGTFQPPQSISEREAELGIVLGDFNQDGLLDFVLKTNLGMDFLIQK